METKQDNRPVKPLLINIHVEPDGTFVPLEEKGPWRGFEIGVRLLSDLRNQIEMRTGTAPHFSWQFRADSQIERQYGVPGWAFFHYHNEILSLKQAGDDIGLHQHAYRWDDIAGTWTEDYGDQAWIEDVVSTGFEAYREAFGHAPDSFTAGVTWTNTNLVNLVERLGAKYDTTAAPMRNKPYPIHLGDFSAEPPDTSRMPLHPYHPSKEDFLIPDRQRETKLWIIPLTTGRQSAGGTIKRNLRRIFGQLGRHEVVTKLYLQSPVEYLSPMFDVRPRDTKPSHFTLDIRTDAFRTLKNRLRVKRNINYLTNPERPWKFVFATPEELVKHYQNEIG